MTPGPPIPVHQLVIRVRFSSAQVWGSGLTSLEITHPSIPASLFRCLLAPECLCEAQLLLNIIGGGDHSGINAVMVEAVEYTKPNFERWPR